MGATGLWEVYACALYTRSLQNLSTMRGFQTNNRGLRTFIVGIDISIQIAAIKCTKYHKGDTGALKTFFFKLCHLQKAAVTPVFVFDGPGRPNVKRGKKVTQEPLAFTEQLKRLIKSFGFYFYDAPGEADAELAQLNKLGFIDAVITEDGDVLVFGATRVIRTLEPAVDKNAHVFEATAIASAPLYLDEDGLLLIILMGGGDYDKGIPNCGAKIAHALAKHGLGGELRRILTSYSGLLREQHLATWRNAVQAELRTNSSGFLASRHPKLADDIPDNFPDMRVVDLYINPLTSWSPHFVGHAPDVTLWIPREPVIHEISKFCVERLHWRTPAILKKRFASVLWPGVAFRMISSVRLFNCCQSSR
ncbi:PIN domain-like protein [Mycena vulgaris]|nr:PIN domain-like protein [Mycena vulgaris]KAJ6582945.1 PIN domain-like protein [Mycena vulgaris]